MKKSATKPNYRWLYIVSYVDVDGMLCFRTAKVTAGTFWGAMRIGYKRVCVGKLFVDKRFPGGKAGFEWSDWAVKIS